MDLKNSHGGYAGKSLAEKMRAEDERRARVDADRREPFDRYAVAVGELRPLGK